MNRWLSGLIALLVGTCWLGTVTAQNNERQFGKVKAIVLDPDDSDALYIGTTTGIYHITKLATNPRLEPFGLEGIEVNSLLFDPHAEQRTLYAGTFAWGLHCFTLIDGNWVKKSIPEVPLTGVNHLVFDLRNPKLLYVVTNRALYTSAEVPRLFQPTAPLPADIVAHRLVIDPTSPGILRLKGYNPVFYISTDEAKTWEQDPSYSEYLHSWRLRQDEVSMSANTNQESTICWRALVVILGDTFTSFDILPEHPDLLIVGTFGRGVNRVFRQGNSWIVRAVKETEKRTIASALVLSTKPLHMYAGTVNDILYTADDGETWSTLFGS